jgi:uncharacterized membrane protein
MTHKIQAWLYHNTENLAGFVTGSVTGSVFAMTSFLDFALNMLQTLILALLSGALGATGAHYAKKFLTKNKDENTKDQ